MPSTVPLRYPVNVLTSFHYFRRVNLASLRAGGLRSIADSGAYSAESQGSTIDPDEFAAWVVQWRSSLAWAASLDVIGDADASYRNWAYLRRTYGIEFLPTIHYGDTGRSMRRYVEQGVDFIGLGGMVAYKSEPRRLLRWALAMFRYARDNHPDVRFHGWGVAQPLLIQNLPWYSVDSGGWGRPYRYASLSLFDRRTGRFVRIKCDGRDAYAHWALIARYGVIPSDVARSTPANRPLLCRLSAAAFQHLEDHLRARGPVSAPRYGLHRTEAGSAALDGPHIHLVDGSDGILRNLLDPTKAAQYVTAGAHA